MVFLFRLMWSSASGSWLIEEASRSRDKSWTAFCLLRWSLARVRRRDLSSIVLIKSHTSSTFSSFSSQMGRCRASICRTALLCVLKREVKTGRSEAFRVSKSYLRNLSMSIPWVIDCQRCFWMPPFLLLIRKECTFWHFYSSSSILESSFGSLGS